MRARYDAVHTSALLVWLASHRGRLRSLVLGGKHLSVIVLWDSAGNCKVHRTEAEENAMGVIVHGPEFGRQQDGAA